MPLACIMFLESKIPIEIKIQKPYPSENNNLKQMNYWQAINPFECTKGRKEKMSRNPWGPLLHNSSLPNWNITSI